MAKNVRKLLKGVNANLFMEDPGKFDKDINYVIEHY